MDRDLTLFCTATTLFTPDGELDEVAQAADLRRLVDAGLDGVVLCTGGTGEGHSLSHAEAGRVCAVAARTCPSGFAVYGAVHESRTTAEACGLAQALIANGAQELSIYPIDAGHGALHPMRATDDEQARHFDELLAAADGRPVAIVISPHLPQRLSVDFVSRLCSRNRQIAAVNVMGFAPAYFVQLREALPGGISMRTSTNGLVDMLAVGAQGLIASEPNIIPKTCRSVLHAFAQGDMPRLGAAMVSMTRFLAYVNRWDAGYGGDTGIGRGPRWVKMALKALGLNHGAMRPPYILPSGREFDDFAAGLGGLGIAELGQALNAGRQPL